MDKAISDKNVVFLLARHPPSFKEMFKVALALRNEGMHPVFLLEREVGEQNAELCDKEGIEKVRLWEKASPKTKISTKDKAYPSAEEQKIPEKTENPLVLLPAMLLKFMAALKEIWLQKKLARELISEFSPSTILLNGDRHYGLELPLITEANRSNVPTIVIPSGYSGPEGVAKLREGDSVYWIHDGPFKWVNYFVNRLLPNQSYDTGGGRSFLFYPPWWTIASWFSGTLPPSPWYMGSGNASIVTVDGGETKQRYISHGIDEKNLVITGQPAFDSLYETYSRRETIKEKLMVQWKLNPKKKIVVCALPQLGEHGLLSWDRHWNEINYLVKTLSDQKANVVLSLHPKMDAKQYAYLSREFNVIISEHPLSDILPIADIFVSTFSSTIIWAIMCKIPTIIVDFYNLNYKAFDKFKGCVLEKNRKEFGNTLRNVIEDERVYTQLRENQQASSKLIAPFDGKTMERIINLVK